MAGHVERAVADVDGATALRPEIRVARQLDRRARDSVLVRCRGGFSDDCARVDRAVARALDKDAPVVQHVAGIDLQLDRRAGLDGDGALRRGRARRAAEALVRGAPHRAGVDRPAAGVGGRRLRVEDAGAVLHDVGDGVRAVVQDVSHVVVGVRLPERRHVDGERAARHVERGAIGIGVDHRGRRGAGRNRDHAGKHCPQSGMFIALPTCGPCEIIESGCHEFYASAISHAIDV